MPPGKRRNKMAINTDVLSDRYRKESIDLDGRRLLITNFHNTDQEKDLSEPANAAGFGRVRHFRRITTPGWPSNPLPIDPACKALGLQSVDIIRAQAFQNASCNWRCWYCFVPFDLLAANRTYSDWLSPGDLIDLYLSQDDPPRVIDLTGGQPDLVPEWIPWMMTELRNRGLDENIYVWSDDNLSNDYFWRFLSDKERELITTYKNYGKVCCFKGFDEESFSFNTAAEPELFDKQFELMKRLMSTGVDLYAYATITTPSTTDLSDHMRRFVDRLQTLDEKLPLRTIPLEIQVFTPVVKRLDETKRCALKNQWIAVEAWLKELEHRFTSAERALNIADVRLDG
jgi:uncharacterized Fe-S cluster-containing radical SAM superfamily protein